MIFEQGLTLNQRQPPEVVAVEVKEIERDHHDLLRPPLEFVLQHREVSGAVLCRDHHLAIDDRRSGIDVPGIGCDLSKTVGPVVAAPGQYLDGGIPEMDTRARQRGVVARSFGVAGDMVLAASPSRAGRSRASPFQFIVFGRGRGPAVSCWRSNTYPCCRPPSVLHDRHVNAGAALSIDQLDGLRHGVGIFAAMIQRLKA
jgi:hypothetical protein